MKDRTFAIALLGFVSLCLLLAAAIACENSLHCRVAQHNFGCKTLAVVGIECQP